MSNIVEAEAIILNTRDYGESDRLIGFLSGAHGRLRGLAKGARRSRKRFVHTLEPFSLVQIGFKETKALVWVEGSKLLEPHLALRTEVDRWGYAALICEIILEMVPEREPQEELFLLLKASLAQLSEDKEPLNVLLLFLFRFLDTMGYLPALDGCSICRLPLRESVRWWWRVDQGMLNCPEHHQRYEGGLMLDLGTLVLIQQARSLPLNKIWRLHILQEKKIPLLYGFLDWIRGHIRKDLKSLKLLEQVQSA